MNSFPLKMFGWQKGDHLFVNIVSDNTLVLTRRPTSWTEAYSGKMGDVFGTHEDTMRFLEEERRSWEDWANARGI